MNWDLFRSVFFLIFIAELPGKTAFATLLLASRSRPTPVFIGVALAFTVQTIVAVLFGSLIALLPPNWVHLAAGLMFFWFALGRGCCQTRSRINNAKLKEFVGECPKCVHGDLYRRVGRSHATRHRHPRIPAPNRPSHDFYRCPPRTLGSDSRRSRYGAKCKTLYQSGAYQTFRSLLVCGHRRLFHFDRGARLLVRSGPLSAPRSCHG